MRIGTILAGLWLPHFVLGGPAADIWRPPQPVPAACSSIQFEAVLVDVSKSMNRGAFFDQTRAAIEDYISKAQPCTLLVLGSFGLTADVHDAQFLAMADARDRLIGVVRSLRATHAATNLDEAAKLVELLSYQLRAAYGTPANRLVVRVYSDFESSPSTGKPRFSLGEYLARRMNARYMRVSAGDKPGEQTLNLQTGEGTGADSASLQPKSHKASAPVPALAVGATIAVVLIVLALLWRWSRTRESRPHSGGLSTLLVTETTAAAEEGAPAAVGAERAVAVAPGVPAVFSTDPNTATYIATMVPDAANGELFRIEPLADGSIRIQSPHARLTVNNEPLDVDRRRRVDIREPITVRLGRREFHIIGVFGRPRTFERANDVFDTEALQH